MGGGDFSLEAYEQLRQAYADQQQNQVDDELAGKQLMGQDYGLETLPVDSPWADKIEKWTYPDGKSPFMDDKQSPDEILQIMRDSAQERINASKVEEAEEEEVEEEKTEVEDTDSDNVDLGSMSDEEFDAYIANLLTDTEEEDEDGEEDEDEDEDEDDEEEDEDEEDEEEDEDEDEEDTEIEGNAEDAEDEDGDESEEDAEEAKPEDESADPDDVAAQIAELRAELENMQFIFEPQEEKESNNDES